MSSESQAVSVRNVSKEYKLGFAEPYKALRDVITDAAGLPIRAIKSVAHRNSEKHAREQRREMLRALDDVSFDVGHGEVIGLIGANGAGKSTMLKVLARITEPSSGEVRLYGRVGSLLEVGTGFHPELTGRENVFLNGSILGMRRAEIVRRFDEIVEFSGVQKFLDTPVKRYSSGMQVRLAFAVAAHLQPEILLIDEVLAVGDAEFQRKCLGKMGEVTSEGRTVIFVSHNPMAIRALCPRSILLERGQVVFDGPTDDAYHRYFHSAGPQTGWVEGDQLERTRGGNTLYVPEPVIQAHAVGVLDAQGTPRTSFRSDEDITVAVEYECLTAVPQVMVEVSLADQSGATIFTSFSVDDPELSGEFERGRYRSTCVIPANTFGEANLSLSVQLNVKLQQKFRYRGLLDFDVTFQGFNGNRFSALYRPLLTWSTEEISERTAARA